MNLKSYPGILEAADQILETIEKDPEIQQKLALLNFPQQRVQEGVALRRNAFEKEGAKDNQYNQQWAINKQIDREADTVTDLFREHVKVARIALRNDEVFLHSLKVKRFANGRWALIRQAEHFYFKLLEGNPAALETYNVSQAQLEQTQAATEAVKLAKRNRTRNTGTAKQSTQQKKQAYAALKNWIMEFTAVARFAFRDQPKLLESFGIEVPASVG